MPAVRVSRRRRSSLALSLNPVKPGYYGIQTPSPRPVTFAPNVTPGTYVEPDPSSPSSISEDPSSPKSTLFPPSELPPPPPSRRRVPPGKRRSLGYIPRPPNAFMLFRADFVRQRHVPGTIETNHGSLSKIIGNCWRSLPLDEKRVWEIKAKNAKAEHKARYPEYRFRPVHNKNKEKKKDKATPTPGEERRCEEVAQLLLEGKKGDELAAAIRKWDRARTDTPEHHHLPRRSSSVPLPGGIALPSLPFLSLTRAPSPVNISYAASSSRTMVGQRRASSARPYAQRSWTMPEMAFPAFLRDNSPLPDIDASLFDPSFLNASELSFSNCSQQPQPQQQPPPFDLNEFFSSLPPNAGPSADFSMSPLEPVAPHDVSYAPQSHQSLPELDVSTWLPFGDAPSSDPSSAYSGSPSLSESSLPVHAPRPQHPAPFDSWDELSATFPEGSSSGTDMRLSGDSDAMDLAHYAAGLENFDSLFTDVSTFTGCGTSEAGHHDTNLGFGFSEMIHHDSF